MGSNQLYRLEVSSNVANDLDEKKPAAVRQEADGLEEESRSGSSQPCTVLIYEFLRL